jgi:hypothetical protein
MITLCAWCGCQYGFKAAPPWFVVSHGICRTCSDKVLYEALGPSPSRESTRHTTEHNGCAWNQADSPLTATPVTPCESGSNSDLSRDSVPPHRLLVAEAIPGLKEGQNTVISNALRGVNKPGRGADRPQSNRGEAIGQPRLNHKEGLC